MGAERGIGSNEDRSRGGIVRVVNVDGEPDRGFWGGCVWAAVGRGDGPTGLPAPVGRPWAAAWGRVVPVGGGVRIVWCYGNVSTRAWGMVVRHGGGVVERGCDS